MDNKKVASELIKMAREILSREVRLVALIVEQRTTIKKEGVAIEGDGIFDKSGKEYAGGLDEKGIAYGSEVDSNNEILLLNGKKSNFIVGRKYKIR